MQRYATIVVSIGAANAEEAYGIVSNCEIVDPNNPSNEINEISAEYGTKAFLVPVNHDANATLWSIPEVLWGDGNVNMLTHGRAGQ